MNRTGPFLLLSGGAQEYQFGAEARAHGEHEAVGARPGRAGGECVGQDVQDRGRGEVADAAQRVPGHRQSVPFDSQCLLQGLQDLGAAGVRHVPAQVVGGQVVVGEEVADVVADVPAHHVGD